MTFVEITIMDVNDNVPEFLNSSYSFSLPEVKYDHAFLTALHGTTDLTESATTF
jgi:hypothetical protein